jgi:hypothetical protein
VVQWNASGDAQAAEWDRGKRKLMRVSMVKFIWGERAAISSGDQKVSIDRDKGWFTEP